MACIHHPTYRPITGNTKNTIRVIDPEGKADFLIAPCPYCLEEFNRYLQIMMLEDNQDLFGTQTEDNKKLASKQLKNIEELRQRVLDEQAAFDKMEELYLKERENFRVLTKKLGTEIDLSSQHFSRAEALEKSMEITQEAIERDSVSFNLALDEAAEREKVWYERYQDRFEKESRCREEVHRLKDRNAELNGALAEENDFLVEVEAEAVNLRTTLKEVLFQFEGLVQFVSEEEYLDDELEALFVDLLKEARKRLEGKN